MTPRKYCRQKAAASGSSFYLSFFFLPRARRRAIMALYAFCREVDDLVDECRDKALAAIKLTWWREEVERIRGGHPLHPVGLALQEASREFKLSARHLLDIIDGMQMDLEATRYPDFAHLARYCYHVASAVGLLCVEIFGYREKVTLDYARDLGLALQLTNILRDIGEDARRGRIYIPEDELQRFCVPVKDILEGRSSENFMRLMRFQKERAEHYYSRALAQLPPIDRKSQRPGLIMAALYHALLQEMEARSFPVLRQRVGLSPRRKLWLAIRAGIRCGYTGK
ncbi:MAG: presqualene diphosphate synthase HpnD [Zoogloeaceae bacterium]|jgi:phytoene synthase|nr:presqualene diphosphate synthase HpnD [Zoogloeaceae bacterium]